MAASWLEACRSPVVPGTSIHAVALLPPVLCFVWPRWWTFFLMVGVSLVMVSMWIKGREPVWVLRRHRARLRNERVLAHPMWYRRRRSRLASYDDLDVHEAYDMTSSPAPASAMRRSRNTSAEPSSVGPSA